MIQGLQSSEFLTAPNWRRMAIYRSTKLNSGSVSMRQVRRFFLRHRTIHGSLMPYHLAGRKAGLVSVAGLMGPFERGDWCLELLAAQTRLFAKVRLFLTRSCIIP